MNPREQPKIKDAIENLSKALNSLKMACGSPIEEERDKAGIIKNFEFTFELTWLALKRVMEVEGRQVTTPRRVISQAYEVFNPWQ